MERVYYTIMNHWRIRPAHAGNTGAGRLKKHNMESIVFFGKGGIGKSTIASNITAILASSGRKVLHVGCDPKMDSTLPLMRRHIQPFAARSAGPGQPGLADSIYNSPFKNIDCLEAGGPQPGVGCAGTGIGSMLDAMKDSGLLEKNGYSAAVFDVLGDVVCGGFAAPLRRGFAKKVVIVTSEEMLSLYAANRLVMMVNNYARNGVYLAGLAANAKTPEGERAIKAFARAVNTRVLGVIQRDPAVAAAERVHEPAVLASPGSDFARRARGLCSAILSASAPASAPVPMPDADFFAFAEGRAPGVRQAAVAAPKPRRAARGDKSAAGLFAAENLHPLGMEGNQILCDWRHPAGDCRIVLAPASASEDGRARFSDWTVCFHPATKNELMPLASADLMAASRRLSALTFDEMLACFTGIKDFYGGLLSSDGPDDKTQAAPGTPRSPHMAFGQWDRFIFPNGILEAAVPPGAVLVEHADCECRFSGCEDGALDTFGINAGPRCSAPQRGPWLPRHDERIVNTDFNTRDSVFGDEAKMNSALTAAAAKAGPGGLVEFYVGCSPMMLASDTASLVRRTEKETGVKIAVEHFNSFYEHSPAKAALRSAFMASKLAKAAAGRGGKKKYDVNLVNWGPVPAAALRELLAAQGLVPAPAGGDFYMTAASARLQVIAGPDSVLGPAFAKARMEWTAPAAPYGLAGTSGWLTALTAALGRKKPAGPGPALRKEYQRLSAQLRRYAAAFILSPGELSMLGGGTALKTVPVLAALAEAGLKVRLLISGEAGREVTRHTAKLIKNLKAATPGLRVSAAAFGKPEELSALLRSGKELRLVYSDIRMDPRVTGAGKTPFSAALFEPGYDGAVETLRRLLELCEWEFNERYLLR